jgi:hypothetical protein
MGDRTGVKFDVRRMGWNPASRREQSRKEEIANRIRDLTPLSPRRRFPRAVLCRAA